MGGFAIQAVGSDGDIRPLIALGAGLRRAGHDVVVATHDVSGKDYATVCGEHDLRYVRPSRQPVLRSERLSPLSGAEWAQEYLRQLWSEENRTEGVFDLAVSLCAENQVLVSHYQSFPSKAAALTTGTPHIAVQLTHEHTPTKYRPQVGTQPNLGEKLNPVLWEQVMDLFDSSTRHFFDGFWRSKGLPPFEHVWSLYFSETTNLLAVSPTLCPPQPDWEDRHFVTGAFLLPQPAEGPTLRPETQAFIDAGPPPVFMTLGSAQDIYPGSDAEKNLDLMCGAALESGCRALIQASPQASSEKWDAASGVAGSERIRIVGHVPYHLIFEQCSLVVHHGGAGTCELVMRSGRPSIVLPFTGHHWFLGYELHRVGVAPRPLPMEEIDAQGLAQLIRQTLDSSSIATRAEEVGREVAGQDGVESAVGIINAQIERGALPG